MNNIFNFKKVAEATAKAMVSIGFSEEEAKRQLADLGEIISMAIIGRLAEKKPEIDKEPIGEIEKFIKSNFSEKELNKIIKEESDKLSKEYFLEITQNLSEDKKRDFFKQINEAFLVSL